MAISIPLRLSLLVTALAPIACTFPVKSGDNPLAETTDDPDPGTGDEPSTGSPTSGEAPDQGSCGDGEVRGAERCDDGNDDPNDGCDMTCQRSGVEEWLFYIDEPAPEAIALSATGPIALVGGDLVTALDHDGVQLWHTSLDDPNISLTAVQIDEQGTIYASSQTGTIHALDANGDVLWSIDAGDSIRAIALGHGALYSVDLDFVSGTRFVLRKHDRSTGAVLWARTSPDTQEAHGAALAVTGPHVVVAGTAYKEGQPADGNLHPLLAVYDEAGALQSLEVADEDNREWTAATTTSEGGLALVGYDSGDVVVGRLDADLAPQWTLYAEDSLGTVPNAVAAGPAGTIAVTGFEIDGRIGFIRRLDAAGATMWTTQYAPDDEGNATSPTAVACGPDFIVTLGTDEFADTQRTWLRRFSAE